MVARAFGALGSGSCATRPHFLILVTLDPLGQFELELASLLRCLWVIGVGKGMHTSAACEGE